MSIADKIQQLATAKENIATAIVNKGGTVKPDDGFNDFSSDIEGIVSPDTQQLINLIERDENFALVIPSEVTTIGKYAFGSCERLTSIVIPSEVTSIGDSAFSDCTRLTSIIIPSKVTTISNYAFYNCRRLASVDLTAFTDTTAIPTLTNSNVFGSNASGRKFIVANAEMKAAFSAATNWSTTQATL